METIDVCQIGFFFCRFRFRLPETESQTKMTGPLAKLHVSTYGMDHWDGDGSRVGQDRGQQRGQPIQTNLHHYQLQNLD